MPNLQRRGKKWRLRWRHNGKVHSATYTTKSAAAAAERVLAARIATTQPAHHRPIITLKELATRWMDSRPQTYRADDEARVLAILGEHPQWLRSSDISREALLALPFGKFRVMRALLGFAADCGQKVDPAALRARQSRPRKPEPPLLTPEQVAAAQAIADRWGPCYGLAVHLVATYGHRPASICAAAPAALSSTGQLTLPIKGGDTHAHPVLPETAARWKAAAAILPPGCPKILIHSGGAPWKTSRGLTSWYYHQCGRIAHHHDRGIYALKRYAISTMLSLGLDSKTIASITGHRTVSLIVNTYARTNETRQRAALAALRPNIDVTKCDQENT